MILGLSGCGGKGMFGGAALAIRSVDGTEVIHPQMVTSVFRTVDGQVVDVYLSDIPRARLVNGNDDLGGVGGQFIHLHVFMMPEAGSTPVDPSACNTAMVHAVMTNGSIGPTGVYGGGGFLLPSGGLSAQWFGGSIRDASHRLLAVSEGFEDVLGPAVMTGRISATRDDAAAAAIAARIEALRESAKSVVKLKPMPSE